MKHLLKFILILLLPGCLIMINENNYRSVNEEDKVSIKMFDIETFDQVVNNQEELILYEINTKNLKNCIRKQKYTWVHLWNPYCYAEQCKNIDYYINTFKTNDLKTLIVSETYDFEIINKRIENSNYNKPIFVLQDSYYGHKRKKNSLMFFNEINQDTTLRPKFGYEDYLFKDTVLIFAGNNLEKEKVDSLLINNNR